MIDTTLFRLIREDSEDWEINLRIHCAIWVSSLKVSEETKQQFESYFNDGLGEYK